METVFKNLNMKYHKRYLQLCQEPRENLKKESLQAAENFAIIHRTICDGKEAVLVNEEMKRAVEEKIRNFRLPDYEEIPDVGLYLEQTCRSVTDFLAPLESVTLTTSMISNYVKKGLIQNPVKKLYYRSHIAYIIFVAVAKTVLSLEDLQLFIALQKRTYDERTAYQYFCREFENILKFIFGVKEQLDEVGNDHTDEKIMLRNTIITVAHKIFLDQCFLILHKEEEEREDCVRQKRK